nr:TonB-dependent receptor [Sphingobium sp. SYK-6]
MGGVRYTWEQKSVEGVNGRINFPWDRFPVSNPPGTVLDIGGKRTDKAVNFRAGFEFDIAPASMLYANISTGFKAGGFFADIRPNEYKPEHLTAYQAGIKNRFFDNRLQLNVEGFYWDYKDKQQSYLSITNSGGIGARTDNAGKATLYGADFSIVALVTKNDTVSADLSYNHTRYDEFQYTTAQLGPSAPLTECAIGPVEPGVPFPRRTIDCSGFPLVRAPKWSGRVGWQHSATLNDGSKLELDVTTQFSSSYYLNNDFTAYEKTDFYHTTDLTLSWTSAGRGVAITGFVKNLEDKAVYTGGSQTPALPGYVLATIRAPRTFGGRIRFSF